MSIYVESLIRADLEALWVATQDPERHERWDLRFTRIEYLPRPDAGQPQQFLYATRIGAGFEIRGEGESIGEAGGTGGSRVSALKFWSDDSRSLIRKGSGYWKYIPGDDGVRFLTQYDYEVRFGLPGRLFDAAVFRPLLGWATAWSFDRLRLWLEREIPPAVSMRQALIHFVSRTAVALVWIYEGLVPKILARHPDELSMLAATGVPADRVGALMPVIGVLEVAFGGLVLLTWPSRWPMVATVMAMALALATVAATAPGFLSAPFNPVTLNLCVAALSVAAIATAADVPLARRCLRRRPDES